MYYQEKYHLKPKHIPVVYTYFELECKLSNKYVCLLDHSLARRAKHSLAVTAVVYFTTTLSLETIMDSCITLSTQKHARASAFNSDTMPAIFTAPVINKHSTITSSVCLFGVQKLITYV